MEENVKRASLGIISLLLAACGDDPARSVKIVSAQAVPTTTVYKPPRGPDRDLIPEFCPPPEESPGPGGFRAQGPCRFQHRAPVDCQAAGDDFIVAVPRKASHGAMLVIYLNVEHYHGPDSYSDAQLFVALEGGDTIYRWSNDKVRATVGPGEAFVTVSKTQLEPELMRIACSRLIAPESNYTYQCAAQSSANMALNGPEIVSGKLSCRVRPGEAGE
jgi:hypothetical protein